MYIQTINRGFVVMTKSFDYVVEAVFISDVVEISFKGRSVTFPSPREILLHDEMALLFWIKQRVIEVCSNEFRSSLNI